MINVMLTKFCDQLYFLIPETINASGYFISLEDEGAGLLVLTKGVKIKEVYGVSIILCRDNG